MAVKSLSLDVSPSEYRAGTGGWGTGPDFFIGENGTEYSFAWKSHESSLKAYFDCPPLMAVINRKAQAYINGKTWIMNTMGKAKGKESTTEPANKIRNLMRRPNPLQSWKQFEAQQHIYMQVYGYNVLLPIIPAGYEQYGPIEASSMWNIPPYLLDIEETDRLFYQTDMTGILKNIKLKYKNTEPKNIDPKAIHIFKDIVPSMYSMIFPESRIRSLVMPINNIIGALESRYVLINKRGAIGILSKDTGTGQYVDMPWPAGEKENLQKDFERYGLRQNQWKVIITTANLKWQQMAMNVKDLMLIEEVQEGTKSICDAYGYPPHLLGIIDPTFNNQNAAQKGLYQDTIIPEAESTYEQWNNVFKTSEYNIEIQKDFDHLPILQKDKQAEASARSTMGGEVRAEFLAGMITMNRALELLGEDTITDGDVYVDEWNRNHQAENNNHNQNPNQNNNNGTQQEAA